MKTASKLTKLSGSFVGLLVVVCIAIAANTILGNLNLRKDLTEDRLYELSDGTREILSKLKQPIVLKFFFNSSSTEVPVPLKQFAQRVEDLLVEYEVAGGGNIRVENYDPKPDSDAEDWAQKYGLSGQSLGFGGPVFYLGLVASTGGVDASLPVIDPRTETLIEYNITRMIARMSAPSKPVVGIMSSLPVMGSPRPPYPMPGQPPPQPAWFALEDLKQDYEVRQVDSSVDDIDADLNALVLIHPKNLEDKTLYAIDQFVLRGGSLVVFLDPLCVTEAENQPNPQRRFGGNTSNLPELLAAWDVSFDSGKVVADWEALSRLRAQNNQVQESPVWLSLRRRHMAAEDVLTSNLESIMMPYAGAFSVEASSDVSVTPLMTSSESAGLVDALTAQFSVDGIRRDFKSGMKTLNLAVRLRGKLKTAFPDGRPAAAAADGDGDEDEDEQAEVAEGLKESVDKSTVVLFGDVDMLYDRFCVREMSFFGHTAHQPMNDNLALFGSTIDQVAGSPALVSIRTRGKSDRPFEVVLDLQRKAQEKYLSEETILQQRLEDAQRKLGELQAQKDEKQRYIMSPEQQKEIANFQEQVAETKNALKLVRRKLRADIEQLGLKLKLVNIVLMPALVSVAGVSYGVYRSKRKRS